MTVFSSPPKPRDIDYIFIADVDDLVRENYPDHEGQHPLFKKFGIRSGGICDCWYFHDGWENFSELEKWKYIALCSLYWEKQYQNWLDKRDYELYKLELIEWSKKKPEFLDTYNRLIKMEKEMQ